MRSADTLSLVFFFFQAEDGIRDLIVTGVQTCALPIFGFIGAKRPRMVAVQAEGCAPMVRAWEKGEEHAPRFENAHTIASGIRVPQRSEERRVGKECRSRWSPYH